MKMVVANWKMNGSKDLCHTFENFFSSNPPRNLILCPPFVYLNELSLKTFKRGGQTCHTFEKGAFTGEVSAKMLADVGCGYVLIGHSERRQLAGENNDVLADKLSRVHEAGLVPILCVGESLAERDKGEALNIIESQLFSGYSGWVAYEPVWAIGTGLTPTQAEIDDVHRFIKSKRPGVKVFYGGSVKAANALEILSSPEVDGVLVGGASLDPQELKGIIEAAK